MIKGAAAVLEYFDQVNAVNDNAYKYFSIYRRGQLEKGNASIATPKERSDWSFDQARDMLSKWLQMQQFGEFTIMVNDAEKASSRGNMRQDFTIEYSGHNPVISGPQMSNEDIEGKINRAVADALAKDKQEREIVEMRSKLAELEKEKKLLEKEAGDPWNKFIGSISPYMPQILQETGIIKNVVAGPNTTATAIKETDKDHPANDQTDNDATERLTHICKKFHQARPDDWLEVLEFFADKILAKPGLVETAKSFL